jgi:hypothetical protein
VLAMIGNAVQSAGIVKDPASLRTPMLVLFVALTIAFAFSTIPVMVKLVLGFQNAVGNQDAATGFGATFRPRTPICTVITAR